MIKGKYNPQFKLGEIKIDESVYSLIDQEDLDLRMIFAQHQRANWGDSPPRLNFQNDRILSDGLAEPIQSNWNFNEDTIIIKTNADRTVTDVFLLNEENENE